MTPARGWAETLRCARRDGRGYAALALVLVATPLAAPLAAQGRRSGTCALPDTTKEWFTQQRAWLDEPKHDWSNDTLRAKLLTVAGLDGSRPVPVQRGWSVLEPRAMPSDSATLAMLRGMLRQRGAPFPTRSVVGAAGARAVFLLVLGDSALEASTYRRMQEAGLGEGFEADVAVLEDRVRVRAGRGQLYGTAFRVVDGALVPPRIEDSAHVDLRRDAAGMPTLAQSLCDAMRARVR